MILKFPFNILDELTSSWNDQMTTRATFQKKNDHWKLRWKLMALNSVFIFNIVQKISKFNNLYWNISMTIELRWGWISLWINVLRESPIENMRIVEKITIFNNEIEARVSIQRSTVFPYNRFFWVGEEEGGRGGGGDGNFQIFHGMHSHKWMLKIFHY